MYKVRFLSASKRSIHVEKRAKYDDLMTTTDAVKEWAAKQKCTDVQGTVDNMGLFIQYTAVPRGGKRRIIAYAW